MLFRFALACLQTGEDELLEMTETLDINTYLRSIGDNMTDINETVKVSREGDRREGGRERWRGREGLIERGT